MPFRFRWGIGDGEARAGGAGAMFLSAHSWAGRVQTRSKGMFQGIPKRNLPFELSFIKELTLRRKADRVRSFLSLNPLVLREFATGFDWALALNRVLRLAGPLSTTVGPKSTG